MVPIYWGMVPIYWGIAYEFLIRVGADVRSEYSNIRYLHLIIGKAQKFVSGDKYDF